jgi:hypothetical protein
MDDNTALTVGVGPATIEPYSNRRWEHDHESKKLKWTAEGGDRNMLRLLKDMKAASGLSMRALAERMGIQRSSLNQYFWQRRKGGSSRISWFLRYAEACGCRVWLTFPSMKEQVQLKAKYYRPPGNPKLGKKGGKVDE